MLQLLLIRIFPHNQVNKLDSKTKLILTVVLGSWGIVSLISIYLGSVYLIKLYDNGIIPEVGILVARLFLTALFFFICYFSYYRGLKKNSYNNVKIGFIFLSLSLCLYFGIFIGVVAILLVNIPIKKLNSIIKLGEC